MPVTNTEKVCSDFINSLFNSFTSHLKIIQQNIRSMRKNFETFALNLQTLDKMPDIIILTEIWIQDNEVNQYSLPHYSLFSKSNILNRSGGVAVFVSDRLQCHVMPNLNLETADCLYLQITLSHIFILDLIAVYRLQEFSIERFVTEFDTTLANIKSKNVIVNGDLNINTLEQSRMVESYLLQIASHGLIPLITEPTRVTVNTRSCIDHILVRCAVGVGVESVSWVVEAGITDHRMTVVCLKIDKIIRTENTLTSKHIIDYNLFKTKVQEASWENVYSADNVSLAFNRFINSFNQCIVSSYKSYVINERNEKLKPWINKNLLEMIKRKNLLYKRSTNHPNNLEIKHSYNVYKNKLLNKIRESKNRYYNALLINEHQSPKKQWDTIKELIGENNKTESRISLREDNNSLVTDPMTVSNKLNKFFCSVASNLRIQLNEDRKYVCPNENEYLNMFKAQPLTNTVFFYPTVRQEVSDIIRNLSNRKAPGYDNISSLAIKLVLENIIDVLVYLINFSLSSGEFPDELKISIVKPLFKKNDKLDPSNYRPISLLSIFSKVLEKVVKVRIVSFLEKNKYLSENQFGFRQKLSTTSALLRFMGEVYTGINEGKQCSGMFIDVMKAFDTVDHATLLLRLQEAVVRGVPLRWFSSYLEGRTQRTRVNGVLSEQGYIKHGIPQGSVLSGPLFLVYVNNLCNGCFKGKLVSFADDTALFYKADSVETLKIYMQHDVNALRWWFTKNFMVMSPKSKYIVFNLSKEVALPSPLRYHNISCNDPICNCLEIEQVSEIKYLGLWVDARVNWKSHINYLKRKLVQYVRIFYMLSYVCNQQLLRTVYYALVNSKLEYGLPVWGGAYSTTIKPLIIIQKIFIRRIAKKPKSEPSAPLFKDLKILPLKNLFIFKVLRIFFNKCEGGNAYINNRSRVLRNRRDISIPRPNLTFFKKFYLYLAPKFFNCLPLNLKVCSNKTQFVKLLWEFLMERESVDYFFHIIV